MRFNFAIIGGYSEIIFEDVSSDLELFEKALINKKYKELNQELQNYIKDFKTKVLVSTGKKDAYSIDIKENTVKFTQAWDIISSKKPEYEKFVVEEFYPLLEKMDITVAGEWEVLIGDGSHIICEGRAGKIDTLVSNLQSKKFRKIKQQLKQFIYHYESRILAFHIHKVLGYKSAYYNLISD